MNQKETDAIIEKILDDFIRDNPDFFNIYRRLPSPNQILRGDNRRGGVLNQFEIDTNDSFGWDNRGGKL